MAQNQPARRVRLSGTPCRRFAILLASLAAGSVFLVPACGDETPFEPPPPPVTCVYTVATTPLSFDAAGGAAQVSVSTAATCAWTARSEVGWASITAGAAGTGPGVVTVAAASNTTTAEREGAVVIADHTVPVRQAGTVACTYEISPSSATMDKDGGTGTLAVTAAAHCAWTAASETPWLTVTSGASGSGSGTVTYLADRNTATTGRSGTIAAAGRSFVLHQEGDPYRCQYSVSPVTFSPCMTSGDLTSTISTEPGCPWTASPGASWITVVSGNSGSGPGAVTFRVSDNWDPPRSGVVEIRWLAPTLGQNLQIAQAGCHYSVSRDSFAFGADGGSGTLDVYQMAEPNACGGPLQDRCLWTATVNVSWITITSSVPRTGDNPLSFTIAPNDGPARTGIITVRDKTVQISQAGR
jgi:hypothetical protein